FFRLQVHFLRLIGMNDYYAHSKVENGKLWVRQLPYPPEDILFIGDTTHDFEVARAMGTDCVLVSFGHQSEQRLIPCGVPLFDSLKELQDRILS
ncbi:MAG: HAD family hydrolase, partial [Sedimentisphaerales bacterium]|nr:HAD family hydrolase [Sedimentisphaerales bacterium]